MAAKIVNGAHKPSCACVHTDNQLPCFQTPIAYNSGKKDERTLRLIEDEFVLAARSQLGTVFWHKDKALEFGEVDDFGVGFAHPEAGSDLVGDEGGPHGCS